MIKTLKDLNQAGRRFWAGANAKTKDAVPPGMEKCPNCGGFGRKYGETCSVCHGKGFVPEGSDFGTDADQTGSQRQKDRSLSYRGYDIEEDGAKVVIKKNGQVVGTLRTATIAEAKSYIDEIVARAKDEMSERCSNCNHPSGAHTKRGGNERPCSLCDCKNFVASV